MVDASHNPIPEPGLPVARAARGEQFSFRFAFGQSDDETWYIATGNPRAIADGASLGIVTIRQAGANS